MVARRKNGLYVWTVRLLVFVLVFGQFGVYGGNRAHAASGTIVSSDKDYRYVLSRQGDTLSVNQVPIDLGWARSYSFSATGYSFSRSQSIRGTVQDITNVTFGSYTSTYAGKVNNAFLIDFNEVWEYYSVMEFRQSGKEPGYWNISKVDEFGMETPRYVQSYEATQLSLIVDADTGRVVDFVSNLNPYYTRKAESFSFVKETGTKTPITTVPATPVNLAATASDTAIHVNWNAAEQAVQYEIEENGVVKEPFYGVQYRTSPFKPNTTYTYRVRGVNTIGAGQWSEPFELTTLLEKPVLKVTSEESKNTIEWKAIEFADRYQLQIDGGTPIELGNVTSYVHEGLEANSTHTYVLKAFSANNESAWSKSVSQLTVPDRADGLKVTDVTFNKLTLAWTAVKGATGYDLEINGVVTAVTGTTYSKTGLTANTEYSVRIRPKNAGGAGSWSDPITGITQMSTPVIEASPSQEEVVLVWAAVDGATSYEVEADGVVVEGIEDLIYNHAGLTPGTAHKYRVRAISENNTSAWSAIKAQNTLPGSVAGLVVSAATNAAITLKWNVVSGATGYDMEIDGVVVAVTGSTYTKSGLGANTEHTFRIRSKNAAGAGAWSELVTSRTLFNTPVLKATSEKEAITLTWPAIADATEYEVEADGVVSIVTEPTFTHLNILPGTSHKYRVRVATANNTSAWTTVLTQSTLPDSVAGLVVTTATNTTIAVKWNAVTGATGYDLEVDGTVVPVSGLTYNKTALAANTEHTFRVRSKNTAGVGAWSEVITATTLLNTPVLKAASEETAIQLTWADVADATKYEIEADGIIVGTVNEPTYQHMNLLPGTAHKYRVRALTETNMSAWTAVLSQNTLPGSVTGLNVTSVTNVAIALKWNAVTGATGYDLEIDGTVVPVSGLVYTKSGLGANTDHTFRVRSKNAAGVGAWSEAILSTTMLNTPVLTGTSEETSITLTWPDVTDATKYEIEADGIIVGTVSEPTYQHGNLLPGTAHKYRVRALTEDNTGAWTAVLSRNTLPGSVTGLTITSTTSAAIALKWNAVTGATGYDLEIDGTVVSVSGLVYTKSGLGANTDHTFRIRSKNAAGVGAWSDLVTGVTQLSVPILKAVSEETAITITWPEVTDATKYEVEADGVVVGTVANPKYTHEDILPGTAHKYRVRALTDTNSSIWTAILTQSTLPGSVTGLNVTSTTSAAIALKWNAVTGATGYDLEIDGTVVSVSGLVYTKSGLGANTDHTFRIRSKNAAGVGAWSDLLPGTTLLTTPVLKATSEETAVTLTWAEVKDATAYEVEADGTIVGTVDEPTYVHNKLLAGTAHKYRVRALTDTNTSAWTAVLTQNTIPGLVTGLSTSSVTNTAIALKWNAVTGATAYDLEIDGVVVPVTGVAYTKTGLITNTEHTFRIRGKNAAGTGAWSEIVTAYTQLNVPIVKTTSEETAITLNWAPIADATAYEIEADGVVVDRVSEPTYTHRDLLGGTVHKYRVRALTEINSSAWTAIYSSTTLPAVVSGLSVNTTTANSIAIRWNAATGASGYDLEVDGVVVAVTGTTYSRNNFTANTEHTFRIRAKNAIGAGAWSEALIQTTQLATPILKGTADKTSVSLTWDSIAGASSYEVEADGQVVAITTDPSWAHVELLPSSLHRYRIRAFNEQNTSIWSSILSVRTTLN
ncbi:fibronectin type III domain-containing protein [Paenibacillus sp. MER 99-2]|uniref:fibronectin type III domain-containing protein n=1 Tax=Paenibacillus sp. MER 99-2 TaxID=2939572 RepID=UPI00203E8E37|nr:fibronectin type III domain-containing protein [Paenibacillus sp. MER 99-2]MCM3174151.1 fibronectin type III domain-containing protein [Paenibacillus sp. MER 99-2]